MKLLFCMVLSLLSIEILLSQPNKKIKNKTETEKINVSDTLPLYLKNKKLPPFELLTDVVKGKDSIWFRYSDLSPKKPTVIIYFSPECSHCHHEMKELLKRKDSIANATFVLASFHPLDSIKKFSKKYSLDKMPNFNVGRDEKYYIPIFFKVKFTPFIAVYDKKGNYDTSFEGTINMPELLKRIYP